MINQTDSSSECTTTLTLNSSVEEKAFSWSRTDSSSTGDSCVETEIDSDKDISSRKLKTPKM